MSAKVIQIIYFYFEKTKFRIKLHTYSFSYFQACITECTAFFEQYKTRAADVCLPVQIHFPEAEMEQKFQNL